jgi:hypothetical protein
MSDKAVEITDLKRRLARVRRQRRRVELQSGRHIAEMAKHGPAAVDAAQKLRDFSMRELLMQEEDIIKTLELCGGGQ